jgi:hypothetical protein
LNVEPASLTIPVVIVILVVLVIVGGAVAWYRRR